MFLEKIQTKINLLDSLTKLKDMKIAFAKLEKLFKNCQGNCHGLIYGKRMQ